MKQLMFSCNRARIVGLIVLFAVRPATAQEQIPWGVELGSYSVIENWNSPYNALPSSLFDEIALIGNAGTAFVEDIPGDLPAGLIINANSTLEIRSGGELMIVPGDLGGVLGTAAVNSGRLVGLPGGSFTAESLSSAAAGTIELSGNTSVTINGASQLGGTTILTGPSVSFSTASLTNTGTLVAGITGADHSAIDVSGSATLGGNLMLDFDGVTPEFGDAWDIVDAQSITGGFANVSSNVELGPGLVIETQIVGGGNGQIAQAGVVARLTLEINRRTGQVQIRDLAGVQTTTIDGYSITSLGGTLAPGGWDPTGLSNWIPSEGHETHVGETSLVSQTQVAAGERIDLGNLYGNPARSAGFGMATEDITFEYSVAGGEILTGLIEYTDAHNSVVLVVDPDTGDAWLQNQSLFDIHLDGYNIESDAGSLDPAEWMSFASSDDAWTEANPADYHIGEVNFSDSMLLEGEGQPISLGQIFMPGAARDLVFTFNTAGNGGEPMTFAGIVEYDDGPIDFGPGGDIDGDYSGNGLVEQADLDLVLGNWGSDQVPGTWVNDPPVGIVDQAELDKVLSNWGQSQAGLAAAAGVPEPSGCALALVFVSLMVVGCRVRNRIAS